MTILHNQEGRSAPPSPKKKSELKGRIASTLFFLSALFVIIAVLAIVLMLGGRAAPLMLKVGIFNFLLGSDWAPTQGQFGIATMIVGTIYVTMGALLLGAPLGLGVATYFAEIAKIRMAKVFNPLVDLLAGIPSVIYGFFGLVIIVPWVRRLFAGPGFSVLAGSIVLGVMILPTIISVSREAMLAVPREFREGSMALGATRWQTIFGVVYPAARSGIIAALVLGLGRAFGETMAVIMVTGNMVAFPKGIAEPVRTLTGNVALEMGYATGDHLSALFATGFVLLLFILVLNLLARKAIRREVY
ncbi:MAG: phosphate ABC transporter permease subunit PstC [Methylocystaceae bacterium]